LTSDENCDILLGWGRDIPDKARGRGEKYVIVLLLARRRRRPRNQKNHHRTTTLARWRALIENGNHSDNDNHSRLEAKK